MGLYFPATKSAPNPQHLFILFNSEVFTYMIWIWEWICQFELVIGFDLGSGSRLFGYCFGLPSFFAWQEWFFLPWKPCGLCMLWSHHVARHGSCAVHNMASRYLADCYVRFSSPFWFKGRGPVCVCSVLGLLLLCTGTRAVFGL